uniref:Uncharacterized protein n=1 Tax=Echeneis naucrates TaxID=173247 RepID=A0A665TMZ6_ECHNA
CSPLAEPVNDYLCYSIFTMVCCCLPLGIAALIYSISVSLNHSYIRSPRSLLGTANQKSSCLKIKRKLCVLIVHCKKILSIGLILC